MKPLICLAAVLVVCVSPARADMLDGVIFGVKCMAAADPQACQERAKREADETRQRMRQQSEAAGGQDQARTAAGGKESFGMKAYRNWVENVVCQAFSKKSSHDVDTSYARAMSRYGFMTPTEVRLQSGPTGAGLHAAGYLHETTPGALYRLAQVVHSSDVANGQRQYKLILDLARDGSGTRVTGQYCVTTDDPAGWQDLPPRVLSSLNNTF